MEVEVEVRSGSRHRCERCGASCQGLKVRTTASERASLQAHAATLGIERPFSGPYLRQNWGTCVFYTEGCRLHATFGADAKPAVCRQFPEVDGIDPACFHPGPLDAGTPWSDWRDLSIGVQLAARLRALPLRAVCKPQLLGSLTAAALAGLDHAEPADPGRHAWQLHGAASAALPSVRHHPDARLLLVGGGQLLVGLDRAQAYAAWVRLLRQVAAL